MQENEKRMETGFSEAAALIPLMSWPDKRREEWFSCFWETKALALVLCKGVSFEEAVNYVHY